MPKRDSSPFSSHPFDRICAVLLWALVVLLALSRIDPTDTPWHLATAREAFSHLAWPVVNTFSFSHTEYPLYQQYPLYQSTLYLVWSVAGFEGLSVFCAFWFVVIFYLLQRWAQAPCSQYCLIWLLTVLGLQQRMILRPTLFSLSLLLLLLLAIDCYRCATSRKKEFLAVLAIVATQYTWILSHQIYILGIFIQIGFILTIVIGRLPLPRGIIREPSVRIVPLLIALLISCLLVALTPLGVDAYIGMAKTFQGLEYLRGHVHELRGLHEQPYAAFLVGLTLITLIFSYLRNRRAVSLFELGVAGMLLCMAIVAWRGVGLFVPYTAALAVRNLATSKNANSREQIYPFHRYLRTSIIAGLAILTISVRWLPPLLPIVGQQAGIGRTIGQWPDAMLNFLRNNPPPGEGINLSWYLGNTLIWGLFPVKKVFVDPRTETYPKEFIEQVFEAEQSLQALESLVAEYQATWLIGELRSAPLWSSAKQLLARGDWELVYVDPITFLLVKKTAENEQYRNRHRQEIAKVFSQIQYSVVSNVRAQQLERVENFRRFLSDGANNAQ